MPFLPGSATTPATSGSVLMCPWALYTGAARSLAMAVQLRKAGNPFDRTVAQLCAWAQRNHPADGRPINPGKRDPRSSAMGLPRRLQGLRLRGSGRHALLRSLLPAPSTSCRLKSVLSGGPEHRYDKTQIEQVLLNLIMNAVQAMGGIGKAERGTGNAEGGPYPRHCPSPAR